MYTTTEGIILRQTKTVGGRRMLTVFSRAFGKIGAGTSITEGGRSKTALALRPFTYGRYELFRTRDSISVTGAETVKSFYSIGEDVEKYMNASYALELTDKVLMEEEPAEGIFRLLLDYLALTAERKKAFGTLTAGYQLKLLGLLGSDPVTDRCARCGGKLEDGEGAAFDVAAGGIVCAGCAREAAPAEDTGRLIFDISADIILVLRYIQSHPLTDLRDLALLPEAEAALKDLMRSYYSYHLGIENLKSEGLVI